MSSEIEVDGEKYSVPSRMSGDKTIHDSKDKIVEDENILKRVKETMLETMKKELDKYGKEDKDYINSISKKILALPTNASSIANVIDAFNDIGSTHITIEDLLKKKTKNMETLKEIDGKLEIIKGYSESHYNTEVKYRNGLLLKNTDGINSLNKDIDNWLDFQVKKPELMKSIEEYLIKYEKYDSSYATKIRKDLENAKDLWTMENIKTELDKEMKNLQEYIKTKETYDSKMRVLVDLGIADDPYVTAQINTESRLSKTARNMIKQNDLKSKIDDLKHMIYGISIVENKLGKIVSFWKEKGIDTSGIMSKIRSLSGTGEVEEDVLDRLVWKVNYYSVKIGNDKITAKIYYDNAFFNIEDYSDFSEEDARYIREMDEKNLDMYGNVVKSIGDTDKSYNTEYLLKQLKNYHNEEINRYIDEMKKEPQIEKIFKLIPGYRHKFYELLIDSQRSDYIWINTKKTAIVYDFMEKMRNIVTILEYMKKDIDSSDIPIIHRLYNSDLSGYLEDIDAGREIILLEPKNYTTIIIIIVIISIGTAVLFIVISYFVVVILYSRALEKKSKTWNTGRFISNILKGPWTVYIYCKNYRYLPY